MFTETILMLAAGVFGFFLGRFSVRRIVDEVLAEETSARREEGSTKGNRRDRRGAKIAEKYNLGSPVAGTVMECDGGERPTIVIRPESGKVYAPTGGKVKKIFPGGSEILFASEFGMEMHISVGNVQDDLMAHYFRPRVIRNEVVPKGRLLLEFDNEGIVAEGESADVFFRMRNLEQETDLELTGEGKVKVGEPIVKIY